ncbi:MAG: hydrogenase expression/formation protein HypE [bacterium]
MVPDDIERIILAHGGGGELTSRLLAEHILPHLGNELLNPLGDGAILPAESGRLCLTTDSFVVQPLTFPGGDIGRLAVCGTVNDLAMMGARPLALSLSLIIEEGLPLAMLDRIIGSIADTAAEAGIRIATGDTKVIERQRGDGLLINTTGLGSVADSTDLSPGRIVAGDELVITGNLAEHGLAVMAVREGLGLTTRIESDVAPLADLAQQLVVGRPAVKFLRDPTRGGLAGVLADLVSETGLGIEVDENALPIAPRVQHAAELLGLDPLTVANEGKIVLVCSPEATAAVLAICHSHQYGRKATRIGTFVASEPPLAELVTKIGGHRLIQRPYGEELPRIC